MDFGFPPRTSEPEILADFELLYRQATQLTPSNKDVLERTRNELAAIAREFAVTKPDTKDFSLTREHRKALFELRRNSDLVITRPDKGRATVILTKDDYIGKMLNILNDRSKFSPLGPVSQFDRTAKIEQNLRDFLKRLLDSGEIPESIYNRVLPSGSVRPRMYGLPKIHKVDTPLRPILSMCGSPQYDISKWLCELLKPVVQYYGTRCVKDSFAFSDAIKTEKLSPDGYMCSFDVVSLFTNVPLQEVINICADALYRNDEIDIELTTLSEESFKELILLATSGVEFSFNNMMYVQTDGVAMGSPLGPALANIFVGYYEQKIPDNEWPELYFRYVDDIFSHFINRDKSVIFFERLNSLHPTLCFTVEGEEDGSLPFLDVRVTRADVGLLTSMYRKPTFTGLYTPWDSYSPTRYKMNLVRTLTNRIVRICSPSVVDKELVTLCDIFLKNGYPGHILDRLITLDSPKRPIGPKRCPLIIHLPWLGRQTEQLVKRMNNAIRLTYFAGEVCPVYHSSKSFGLPKDVLPSPSQSNLVYLFECRHCASRYVGKTSQRLGDRIKQHVPRHIINETEPGKKRRGRPPKERSNPGEGYQSAIAEHLAINAACRQLYDDRDFKIISRGRTKSHLNVLEAMYIYVMNPVLCKQKMYVTNLSLFKHAHVTNTSS